MALPSINKHLDWVTTSLLCLTLHTISVGELAGHTEGRWVDEGGVDSRWVDERGVESRWVDEEGWRAGGWMREGWRAGG